MRGWVCRGVGLDGRAFITCDVKELGMCVWVSMWVGGLLCAENLKLYYFKNFKSIILRHIPKIPLNSNSISSINQNQTCTSILHYQHTLPRYRTHQSPSPPSPLGVHVLQKKNDKGPWFTVVHYAGAEWAWEGEGVRGGARG